ncbi:hypothetical protein BC829DRAFT_416891 [Chytridium lagenaria]|nr:hypothetical protein BC829DRAFT_416891 [Chytridium lagenaria]
MASSSSDCSVVSSAFPSLRTSATGCCGVSNVPCDSTGRITRLDLAGNRLTGTIPQELGSLGNLRWLDLSSNQLTGAIPPQLGSLSSLRALYLSNNQLTGAIPQELGNLSNLRWLFLKNNYFSGAVPEYVSNLSEKSIQGNCFSDIRNSSAYSNITQRTDEDCQRNFPGFTPSTEITDTSKIISASLTPSNSAAPGTSISPTSNTATSNFVSPGLITGVVLGILVILGVIAVTFYIRRRRRYNIDISTESPSSENEPTSSSSNQPPTVFPKTHNMEDTITHLTPPIINLRSEPLPPPDDPRDSKSNFFSGLNAIPTASSSRIDKDYSVIPTVTDVQNEKAEELTNLGFMTLDWRQGPSRYDKANEARMDHVVAPARGSSMMVVTSGAAQRSRNNVASWSCEDVEDWLSENGFAPVVVEKFKSHQIDGYQLVLLSSSRLVEMGITVETMRNNLLYAVEQLRVPISPGVGVSATRSMTFANDAPPQYS